MSGEGKGNDTSKTELEKEGLDAKTIVAGIGVGLGLGALCLWGVSKVFGEESKDRRMMKAPGRDYKIYRDDFERDPAEYFRRLRKSK